MKLYEISAEAQAIEMLLVDSEGELNPAIEQRLTEFLAGGTQKLENAAAVLKSLKAQSDACDAESKRLRARSASLEANADRLKTLMLAAVDGAFQGKLKTPLFTIWGQDSPCTASFELVPDADLMKLPDSFIKCEAPTLDTGALWQAWKRKEALPAEVKVTELPGKRSLRVR